MDDEMFTELEASLKEGMDILRGNQQPSRTYNYDAPDVKAIREALKLNSAPVRVPDRHQRPHTAELGTGPPRTRRPCAGSVNGCSKESSSRSRCSPRQAG